MPACGARDDNAGDRLAAGVNHRASDRARGRLRRREVVKRLPGRLLVLLGDRPSIQAPLVVRPEVRHLEPVGKSDARVVLIQVEHERQVARLLCLSDICRVPAPLRNPELLRRARAFVVRDCSPDGVQVRVLGTDDRLLGVGPELHVDVVADSIERIGAVAALERGPSMAADALLIDLAHIRCAGVLVVAEKGTRDESDLPGRVALVPVVYLHRLVDALKHLREPVRRHLRGRAARPVVRFVERLENANTVFELTDDCGKVGGVVGHILVAVEPAGTANGLRSDQGVHLNALRAQVVDDLVVGFLPRQIARAAPCRVRRGRPRAQNEVDAGVARAARLDV